MLELKAPPRGHDWQPRIALFGDMVTRLTKLGRLTLIYLTTWHLFEWDQDFDVFQKSGRLLIIFAQGTDNAASLPHLQRAADGGDLDAIVHVGRPYMLVVVNANCDCRNI